jgi:hypothetical protein
VGRPRTRWVDVVQRDALQLLGITGWRRRATKRDEWRRLMPESKDRKRLWRHTWNEMETTQRNTYIGKALLATLFVFKTFPSKIFIFFNNFFS